MSEFAARRKQLLDAMGDGVAVFPSTPLAVRNNDVEHPYRQDSDLYYLTGLDEPDSVLVLTNQHDEHRTILFVRPRKREREIWDGPRTGIEGAVASFGADVAYPIDDLAKKLPEYLGNVERLHYRLAQNAEVDAKLFDCIDLLRRGARRGVTAPEAIIDPSVHLHEMRMRKSDDELSMMRQAATITQEAHLRAMRLTRPGLHEYEIDAEL
ncbi:MAG: aminopeptidase P family protein, partial [Polyangiales bacterium]